MAAAMTDQGILTYKMIFNAGDQLHGATTVFISESNDLPSEQHPFLLTPTELVLINTTDANNTAISSYMKDWFISFITDMDPNANT